MIHYLVSYKVESDLTSPWLEKRFEKLEIAKKWVSIKKPKTYYLYYISDTEKFLIQVSQSGT